MPAAVPRPSPQGVEYTAMAPLGAHCPGANTKTVTGSDTSIAAALLAPGEYTIWTVERLPGVTVWMQFGAAAVVPNATTGARVAGLMGFPADIESTLKIRPEDLAAGDAALHLISTSTTVTVCLQQIG